MQNLLQNNYEKILLLTPVVFRGDYHPSNQNSHTAILAEEHSRYMMLAQFTQEDLDTVALQLNERPRKTLDYQIPVEVLMQRTHNNYLEKLRNY